uniref:Ribonuclease P protein subunit p30 n=1 Tax=Anthurium amnicola TaxID=1678845 RepID=A0A1D1YK75_9ARAE
MGFFDLNIPYLERDGSAVAASRETAGAANRARRLKAVVKAMELGYTGVAYNRTVRGVVSDADRCRITPFPLSSLLKAAPALAAAARFHRELLGVSPSSPFRQYTRLTVAVDSALGSAALKSLSSILRTYHLVAVRPLNQTAFDQACTASQVDLIAIDFSQQLPFRLKLTMVKAAIERGVYFEITYSRMISDAHIRGQMLSNVKLLVDWTRGKNLIFSSGASSVNELRGPYDVMNLSTLFGVSMERAKLAISKNCRSLLTNALRRKQCYKEAIIVEKMPPTPQLDTEKAWFVDWSNWDPISSGEGDLPALDDIARFFSPSERGSKSYSGTNYETAADKMFFHRISHGEGDLLSSDDKGPLFPVANEGEPSIEANEPTHQERHEILDEDEMLLPSTTLEHQLPDNEDDAAPPNDFDELFPSDTNYEPAVTENDDSSFLNNFDVVYAADGEASFGNLSSICNRADKSEMMSLDDGVRLFTVPENSAPSGVCVNKTKSSSGPGSGSVVLDTPVDATSFGDLFSGMENEVSPKSNEKPSGNLMKTDSSSFSTKDARSLSELCSADDVPEVRVLASADKLEKKYPFMSVYDVLFQNDFTKSTVSKEDDRMPFPDHIRFNKASDTKVQNQRDAISVVDGVPLKEIFMNVEQDGEIFTAAIGSMQQKIKLGKVRTKRKPTHRGLPFLPKHFIHHLPFKKTVHHLKGSRKNLVRTKHDKNS